MATYVILFLLFLLQFVFLPIGTSYFEGSKVYVAEIAIVLLSIIVLRSKKGVQIKSYPKIFLYSLAGIFLLSLYHLFFSQTPTVLFGNNFRLQGTLLIWVLLIFALVSAKIAIIDKKYLPILAFATLVIQFICSLLFIGVGSDRPIGTIGEPNALAASVLFLWPFIYFSKPKTKWHKIMLVSSFIIVLCMIIITGSRSAMIAFVIQLLFLFANKFFPKHLKHTTIFAICLIIISYIFPLMSQGSLYENRAEVWKSALVAGTYNPIFGAGFGNAEYELHSANVQLHNHLPGYYVDSAHNIFLDWWVEGGIVGLGIFVTVLAYTFTRFIKQKNMLILMLLIGLVSTLSFNPASVVSLIGLWWIFGQFVIDRKT